MHARLITLCCAMSFSAYRLPAQIVVSQCDSAKIVFAARGQTIRVGCDSVHVYNPPMIRLRENLDRANAALAAKNDTLIARLNALAAVRDSIDSAKTAMIREFRELVRIESLAYDSLRGVFHTTDSLARASTQNTDRALGYIKKVKIASFVSSALAGGVIGGFGIKPAGESGFHWSGAGVGAAVGVVANVLIMKLAH